MMHEADGLDQEAEKKVKRNLAKSNAFGEKNKGKKQVEQAGKEKESLEKTLKGM